MSSLYLRLGASLVFAVLVGMLASAVVSWIFRAQVEEEVAALIQGGGLGHVAAELERAPPSTWAAVLADVQPHLAHRLSIEPVGTPSSRLSAALPIADSGRQLRATPERGPTVGPMLGPVLAFALTVLLVGVTAVAWPLAAELAQLKGAIRSLGQGPLQGRADADSKGTLREISTELNRSAAQLARLFAERESLMQAVCHELGVPLSRMRFTLEMLAPHVDAPAQPRLEALERDLEQLDEISSELVSWVEAGTPPRREAIELAPVFEVLVELTFYDAGEPAPAPQVEVPVGLEAYVEPRQFQRAIENLLRNATRYARSRVVLAARREGESVVVEVRDDGPGIPADQREVLFEPFRRIDPSRSRDDGGLGLGLAIVHRIVSAHNGHTRIEDAPEGGAAVITVWPNWVATKHFETNRDGTSPLPMSTSKHE
ncbi:MAG: ATP-binding protein [Myxococcota bacterium]